jgi:hypothetical protein
MEVNPFVQRVDSLDHQRCEWNAASRIEAALGAADAPKVRLVIGDYLMPFAPAHQPHPKAARRLKLPERKPL